MYRYITLLANVFVAIVWFAMFCEGYENQKWDHALISLFLAAVNVASAYYIWQN